MISLATTADTCSTPLQHNLAFGGANIKVVSDVTTQDACCAACAALPKCAGWTLIRSQPKSKQCWLKAELRTPSRAHLAISGAKAGSQVITPNLTKYFSRVYRESIWSSAGHGSGSGSDMLNAQGAARILYHVVLQHNITSMIDAPCGGMEWQPQVLYQLRLQVGTAFRYLGLDVVPSVIENDRRITERPLPITPGKYQEQLDYHKADFMEFRVADLVTTPLPSGYDLIMSRDAMQHNSFDSVWAILRNMAAADVRYLLLASYTSGRNRDIAGGMERYVGTGFHINLARDPFSLAPLAIYRENFGEKGFFLYKMHRFRHMLNISWAAYNIVAAR
jgi:hypothetical protein